MAFPGGNVVRVTPTGVVGETADNDVMFDAIEISNAVSSRGGVSRLTGITIIDNVAESVDMDIIFMGVKTNFGTADSASTITDANLQASKVLGVLSIDWSDGYSVFAQDSGSASITTFTGAVGSNAHHGFPMMLKAEEGSTSVYFTAIVRDTDNADYAATDDLEFVFHIEYLG